MLQITNYRQGAILNHNHGAETDKSLKIHLEGICDGHPVKVNETPAFMDGQFFSAEVELTQQFNTVTVTEQTPFGLFSQQIVLVWDKKSFKRHDCYIDDHSFLFTDLAKERPAKAFDHFYLSGLKKIHDKYDLKVTLNCFFRNDHDGKFTLDQMPDIWKSEFIDNSDWLKMSFHAKSEFPDRPYLESTAEDFGKDYDEVKNEIIRFAGEETWIVPEVIHWANIHPVVAQEVFRRGTRCLAPSMRPCVMGGPSLADRMKGGNMAKVQQRSVSGEDRSAGTAGLAMFYDNQPEKSYMTNHGFYYDPMMGIVIKNSSVSLCCNLVPLDQTARKLEITFERNRKSGCEMFNWASHEQYTFPYYPNYLPDHLQRIELAAKILAENGYKSVFFNEGFMGNMSWEK